MKNTASLVCGIVGCALCAISFWIFGWLSIAALILGVVALSLPTAVFSYKICGLISTIVGTVFMCLWLIALMH